MHGTGLRIDAFHNTRVRPVRMPTSRLAPRLLVLALRPDRAGAPPWGSLVGRAERPAILTPVRRTAA